MPNPADLIFLRGGGGVQVVASDQIDPGPTPDPPPDPDPTPDPGDLPDPVEGELQFRYELDAYHQVSIGIFDANDVLRRRMGQAVTKAAGVYDNTWDGLDDNGDAVDPGDGPFEPRIACHNLAPSCEQILNTPTSANGIGYPLRFGFPVQFEVYDGELFMLDDYNEFFPTVYVADTATPNTMSIRFAFDYQKWHPVSHDIQDGTCFTIVRRNASNSSEPQQYGVIRWNVATGAIEQWPDLVATADAYTFSVTGVADMNVGGYLLNLGTNASISDHTYDANDIAAMHSGTLFAVSQPNLGYVRVFTKDGTYVKQFAFGDCDRLCWDAADAYLWGSEDDALTFMTSATWTNPASSITAPAPSTLDATIEDIACYIAGTKMGVAISGAYDQVVPYASATRTESGNRLGTEGGYNGAATATYATDWAKFILDDARITFDESDGSIRVWMPWLGEMRPVDDPFGTAALFGDEGDTIHMARDYHLGMDKSLALTTDVVKLYANYGVEYDIDFDTANVPGVMNGGGRWTRKRFLLYDHIKAGRTISGTLGGIRKGFTSGGHQYAIFLGLNAGAAYWKFVEISDTGMRDTGITVSRQANDFDDDGTWRYVNTLGTVLEYELTGLDGSNNPQYSLAASYPYDSTSQNATPDPGNYEAGFPVMPTGGILVGRHKYVTDYTTWHLGELNTDGSYRAQACRATAYDIPFPVNGDVTIRKTGNPPGCACGESVTPTMNVYNWNGEFWLGRQVANHLFHDANLLYLFSVGCEYYRYGLFSHGIRVAYNQGQNGNALGCSLVELSDGRNFYFHSSETSKAIQMWTIGNLASYQVLDGVTGDLGDSIDCGTITAAGDTPALYDATENESIDFSTYTAGDAIGNGWTESAGNYLQISADGYLEAKSTATDKYNSSYMYRGSTVLNSCQEIVVPAGFFSPNLWGQSTSGNIEGEFGLLARLNTATGARIEGFAKYLRSLTPTGGQYNTEGIWNTGFFFVDDSGNEWQMSGRTHGYLSSDPGDPIRIVMGVYGTNPVRLYLILINDTTGVPLGPPMVSSEYHADLQSAGYRGIAVGMRGCRVTSYRHLSDGWAGGLLPVLKG